MNTKNTESIQITTKYCSKHVGKIIEYLLCLTLDVTLFKVKLIIISYNHHHLIFRLFLHNLPVTYDHQRSIKD